MARPPHERSRLQYVVGFLITRRQVLVSDPAHGRLKSLNRPFPWRILLMEAREIVSTPTRDFVLHPLPKRSLDVLKGAGAESDDGGCPYPQPAGGGGPSSDFCGCANPMVDMCC